MSKMSRGYWMRVYIGILWYICNTSAGETKFVSTKNFFEKSILRCTEACDIQYNSIFLLVIVKFAFFSSSLYKIGKWGFTQLGIHRLYTSTLLVQLSSQKPNTNIIPTCSLNATFPFISKTLRKQFPSRLSTCHVYFIAHVNFDGFN